MIATPKLAALIPEVFANSFDTFPSKALHQAIASPDINEEMLLFRLSTSSNPLHGSVHAELIKRILNREMNIHHYRYVANMLRVHTRQDVVELIEEATRPSDENTTWFL